ncbi:MAG TPA: hypothetical protein VGC54_02560 [Planctomycetota bacterium]
MNTRKNNKGIVLAALLASFLGGIAGASALHGLSASDDAVLEIQDPKGPVNPAQQRAEMIRLLGSMDKHLAKIEKSLAETAKGPG